MFDREKIGNHALIKAIIDKLAYLYTRDRQAVPVN
jgi:hypothetical protein